MSYSQELAEAEAEAQRLRDELRDRDARYEEQALILQERMQAAEEEAQARGEKLAAAHRRIAELEAARPAPDPGGPLTLEMSAHPVGGLRSYLIRRVGAEHVYLRGFGNAEQFLRDLIRAHNLLHGDDDEDDRAFGVALPEAAPRTPAAGHLACADCSRAYGAEFGFPDLQIPDEAWKEISPKGSGGGLLCPSCICARLHARGMTGVASAFRSGPLAVELPPLATAAAPPSGVDRGAVLAASFRCGYSRGIDRAQDLARDLATDFGPGGSVEPLVALRVFARCLEETVRDEGCPDAGPECALQEAKAADGWHYLPELPTGDGPWEVAWKDRFGDRGICVAFRDTQRWTQDDKRLPPECVYAWREFPAPPDAKAARQD